MVPAPSISKARAPRILFTCVCVMFLFRTVANLSHRKVLGYGEPEKREAVAASARVAQPPVSAGAERVATAAPLPVTTRTRGDWAKEGDVPEFCKRIIRNPQPYNKLCHRTEKTMLCRNLDGAQLMFSQFQQDFYLYTRHFVHKRGPGVYVDVAANEPIPISNTFFFDRCLGWRGVCVEANPEYYERLYRLRSCQLVPTCVGSRDGAYVDFLMNGGGGGVLGDTYKSMKKVKDLAAVRQSTLKERCTTLGLVMERENIQTIDYLSLDVEGHELEVLRGMDWERVRINVMTIEVNGETLPGIEKYLTGLGYKRHIPELEGMSAKSRALGLLQEDAIFLHESVKFGSPQ